MSNTPFTFTTGWKPLAPPWLTTGNAELYVSTLEMCRDLLMVKCYQAQTIRLPGQGDASQIPYLAFDSQLVQGPGEPNASFLERVTGANQAWGRAGSTISILEQLQAYLTGTYPAQSKTLPEIIIVGGSYPTVTRWDVVDQATPSIALEGGTPAHTQVFPANFNWDGKPNAWRAWLVLPMTQIPTGQSGSAAETGTAAASACFASPGQNVNGVWVPATSGTPVNSPWLTITGLSGLDAANLNQWLTLSGSSHASNNGTFPIVTILSATSCVIANPNGVASDTGPLTWSIGSYPYIGPGQVWGYPGATFGEGELSTPPIDTGSNVGGVWQPTLGGNGPPTSWGLTCSADVITSIRQIAQAWKNGNTWFVHLVVAFDCGDGTAGNAYSPLSAIGSGNPDGTFGSVGKLVNGTWVPTRRISSPYDAYAQGTGTWNACSVSNRT